MTTSDVTVVGTGSMGAALARALLAAGRSVTVWNRTAERCAPLVAEGAAHAAELRDAVAASEVVLVCLLDYAASEQALGQDGVAAALAGTTLVQLSTGAPDEARAGAAWAAQHGAGYLDGAILSYPSAVGGPDCKIVYAGERALFDRCAPLLGQLGDARHVGDEAAAANVLNASAIGVFYEVALGAFMEGAAYADAEGASIDDVLALVPHVLELLRESAEYGVAQIRARDYRGEEASIDVHAEAVVALRDRLAAAGCGNALSAGLVEYLEAARAAGRGTEEFAALFEIARAGGSRS